MSAESAPGWVDAGPESEFEPGTGRNVDVDGTPVALFKRPEGGFVALTDRCPHAGAPLSSGMLRDGHVVCCWHGWTFEPSSGQCTNVSWAPPVGVHEVRVIDGRVLVKVTSPEPEPGPDDA
jgi:nitrite reductase/ring-hydroxylating ferredoxin subunit